jgi:glycolate oxidase FAD binding subunit
MIAIDSEARVVEIVRAARFTRIPFEIVAGGTRRSFGRPSHPAATLLDVSGLKGIVKYEPEELILTVRPGTSLAEIDQVLGEKGQRLGFDPQDWSALLGSSGTATIGGAIACNADGPAAVRYGRARDHLLGFRGVNGFAEAFKAGGHVVKNVTGFDIPKLVCGAMGTLCVLTELTFRVFPKPSLSRTFAVKDLGMAEGLALLRTVWSGALDATGLAYADGVTLIRLEGEPQPLAEKIALLRAVRADCLEDDDARFRDIGSGRCFVGTSHDVWSIALQPTNASKIVTELNPSLWFADRAGGLLWVGVPQGDMRVHQAAARHGGHAMLLRAGERTRSEISPFPPEEKAHAALSRAVKAAFDPLGLFNPGRMVEGV